MMTRFRFQFLFISGLIFIHVQNIYPQSTTIAPGIVHHQVYLSEGPWAIHILEIDLTNDAVAIESIKANHQLVGRVKTSELAQSMNKPPYRTVAAINGDFFSKMGVPVGAQAKDGCLVSNPTARSVFGMSADKKPLIDVMQLNASIHKKNKQKKINGINVGRGEDELILYNRYYGVRTGTNQWGTEVIIQKADYVAINDTLCGVVTQIDNGHGNNVIPDSGIVLSGHNSAGKFLLQQMQVGDSLKIFIGLLPSKKRIKTLVGGIPRIIRDGKISVEYENEKISATFATDRHPRTAVGFSADSTRLFCFVVDGRQPGYSVGMSLYELAGLMLNYHVYQAINLDGGGSTTMVVQHHVVNRPSDATGERPVANALLILSKAPIMILNSITINQNFLPLRK